MAPNNPQKNTEGVPVCRTAFLQLLGIGRGRLARTKRTFRGEDARKYGAWGLKILCSNKHNM